MALRRQEFNFSNKTFSLCYFSHPSYLCPALWLNDAMRPHFVSETVKDERESYQDGCGSSRPPPDLVVGGSTPGPGSPGSSAASVISIPRVLKSTANIASDRASQHTLTKPDGSGEPTRTMTIASAGTVMTRCLPSTTSSASVGRTSLKVFWRITIVHLDLVGVTSPTCLLLHLTERT